MSTIAILKGKIAWIDHRSGDGYLQSVGGYVVAHQGQVPVSIYRFGPDALLEMGNFDMHEMVGKEVEFTAVFNTEEQEDEVLKMRFV